MAAPVQIRGTSAAGNAGLATRLFGSFAALASSVKQNEAWTKLLLVDNRSRVQIAAAEGTASNFDSGFFGASLMSGLAGGGGGYAKTPQGKVIVAVFADAYNQMVRALRNYRVQTVRGGLGTGGRLGAQGGMTAASREVDAATAKKK